MVKILIVDDDMHIRELMKLYLEDEHFEVIEKSNGSLAYEYLEKNHVDLIILDIMMPKMDGIQFCHEIRKLHDVPILMISAKDQAQDRIKGFQVGTDDYLAKPFDPVEMVLRVKALLKRARLHTDQILTIGKILLNRTTYEINYPNGEKEILPLKEFELLFMLGSYPGQVFTRDVLLEKIWGMDFIGVDRTVDVHIRKLRERLEPYDTAMQIVTLRGIGYRIEVQDGKELIH
ncbi:response regulator transcription factor [Peribacillus aracenensis]|uniref:response regulator transcription factor n=1 Tax=Peribacillus aracenensis TaxID=2976708 RepID=UPI0028834C7D|nr:response regulator transcription factor [Peribacillus sp. BBB004]